MAQAAEQAAGQTAEPIRYERGQDGVVVATIDMPGSANTMNAAFQAALIALVDRLEADRDQITGVILASAKKTFFAGGDLRELITIGPDRALEFAEGLAGMKDAMRRLEKLGRPVVAAVNGAAMGGGLELALSCHHRIALDLPDLRVGFPEATLGLLPGGGGVARTVRIMGVQAALPLLTEGTRLRAAAAVKAGWLDELAADREELFAKARAWIAANPEPVQPWDRPEAAGRAGVKDLRPLDPDSYPLLSVAPAMMYQKTRGCYPAPEKILAAAVEGALLDFDTAIEVESRYFVELVTGQIAKNMIGTFWFQLNEIKAGASRPAGIDRRPVGRVAVLGAGMMGAGIAHAAAVSGIEVVLKDATAEAGERGRERVAALLDARVAKGRMQQAERDEILGRIEVATEYGPLKGADLVIEAVFEDRAVKNEVNAAAAAAVGPDAVLASNTSTLPITGLAGAVPDPGKFVGLHFFSPVDKMPLVEIIRGGQTSDETLARAYDFVLQIGKTPIVVNDSRGFYTSRTFSAYVIEGLRLLTEGVHPALIENVAKKAGFPVGPLAVHDEVTLILSLKVRAQTLADLAADPANADLVQAMQADPVFAVVEQFVHEFGRPGKAGGAGFYDYPADGRKRLWPELVTRYTKPEIVVPEADVRDRLLFGQALEAVRCLEEGVLTSVRDANLGSIMGFGYPAWTGGAVQFVNSYAAASGPAGTRAFAERATRLAQSYGERFEPSEALLDKAARDEGY
ncbi:MAG TPA: 3-hydroxyacyl-CoA dehydrogenase NAD-binding domain-containing protein [Actinocrinis sp.]|nr:3-hydroxyacyl-CoA dehydrogenase NAD-binding domain-containing protein [Actinocrinis sp.]